MKFSLTKNTKELFGKTLYQIKAEMSFGNVSKGELGGYIEKKENLEEDGNAWVSGNAWVYGDARVSGNAWVYGDARVSGNAWVSGNDLVYGNAWVYGKLQLTLGYFFGYKEKKEDLKYFSLGDDSDYELIGRGNCKVGEQNNQKTELLKKAQELIDKANELKDEANKLFKSY
jgi:hypothetical protein